MIATSSPPQIGQRLRARALLVGERLNAAGLEACEMISTTPVALRIQPDGLAVLFRYGVVVLIGLKSDEEAAFLVGLKPRIIREFTRYEEEATEVELCDDARDGVRPGGPCVNAFSNGRLLIVADALAKSSVLAHQERQVAAVFDIIEPFVRELAERGRTPHDRKAMLKLIGNALLDRQRVSGRVAAVEKPDALWDKPELERLCAHCLQHSHNAL